MSSDKKNRSKRLKRRRDSRERVLKGHSRTRNKVSGTAEGRETGRRENGRVRN
jgi:hypothetical protein